LPIWMGGGVETKKNRVSRGFHPKTLYLRKRAHGYLVPDLLIVCAPQKIHEWGICGAPDLVVEIVSPSNASNDKIAKLNKYREIGVKTYWIVEPEYRNVEVYSLDENGHYRMTSHNESITFTDLEIRLDKIFPPCPLRNCSPNSGVRRR
jgi:Uma2 family endonuclease